MLVSKKDENILSSLSVTCMFTTGNSQISYSFEE